MAVEFQLSSPDDERPITQRLLTAEEVQKATDWINEKAAREGDPCQICDSPHSIVQPSIAAMPGGLNPFDPSLNWVHPAIVVACMNCGYIRYFNAITIGLMQGYRPSETKTDA